MAQPRTPGQPDPHVERSGTIIESDEEVRQAIFGLRGLNLADGPVAVPGAGPVPASPPPSTYLERPGSPAIDERPSTATPFRPTTRPPIALLTICDDGKADGEIIRVREPKFVIGRSEGNLRIPVDGRMSSRHAEITLQTLGGIHRWVVTDLQSTHGMFVRVSRTVLTDRAEFLIGNGRYRYEAPQDTQDATIAHHAGGAYDATHGWDGGPGPFRPPAVTEMLGNDIGNRMLLVKPEYWIGADPSCSICRPDDPFCEPRHVRLFRSPKGSWYAEHNHTQNGLWLRMSQIVVDSVVRFQLGEQRFSIRV